MRLIRSALLRRITTAVCWSYALGLVGFVVVWLGWPQLPPFLALASSFTPFWFLPLPPALLLAHVVRSRGGLIAGAVVATLFAGLYGPLFLPRLGDPPCPARPALRVMTFNLGLHFARPAEMVRIIAEQDADVIAVQEMTAPMARRIEQELGATYPHAVSAPDQETTALFSRHPILEGRWVEPEGGGRRYIQAVVAWRGQALDVFVVHPMPPGLEWLSDTGLPIGLNDVEPQRQLAEVTERATALEGPVLIVGDFNMNDYAPGYAIIAETFVDAHREAGWGFGFTFPKGLWVGERPLPGPFTRLDYVFHSRDLCAHRTWVGCEGGSDHCYVVAEIARPDS